MLAALAMTYMEGSLPIPAGYDWAARTIVLLVAWHTGNGTKMDDRIAGAIRRVMPKRNGKNTDGR